METMNSNDLIAQQQSLLQNAQNWQVICLAVGLISGLVTMWVLYMFYARLSSGDPQAKPQTFNMPTIPQGTLA
jgi:hypothetical protein